MTEYRGIELRYGCDRGALPGDLASRFVELSADESTRAWMDGAFERPHSGAAMLMRRAARAVMSDFDANGLLGVHDMRVLGREQWRTLLGPSAGGRLLDVGAGDGAVTAELAPLFDEVITTETSRAMARRLRARGFRCHAVDVAQSEVPEAPFDTVCLLNVIDRARYPRTLLRRARRLLAAGGQIVVAAPLPLRPHVQVGPDRVDPEEALPVDHDGWEAGAVALVEDVLASGGLEVEAWTRVPYLCRGTRARPVEVLDEALFLCR